MFLRTFKNLIKKSKFRFHEKIQKEEKKSDEELKIISEFKKGLIELSQKNYSKSHESFTTAKQILENSNQQNTTNYFFLLKK